VSARPVGVAQPPDKALTESCDPAQIHDQHPGTSIHGDVDQGVAQLGGRGFVETTAHRCDHAAGPGGGDVHRCLRRGDVVAGRRLIGRAGA
jgi:hypothetical protein